MAYGNPLFTKADAFIKSSLADFQDPVFLTFTVDFFPTRESYPFNDGLYNDNLLMAPQAVFRGTGDADMLRYARGNDSTNPNKTVEYSAYDWLKDYYGTNYRTSRGLLGGNPHPKDAMISVVRGLLRLQSSPWYFQSLTGIASLWGANHRIKEGNKKSSITIGCLESIRQPLTDIAENYRYAVYDEDRLAYRLPDNLRWFDMEIHLVESRHIVDHGAGSGILSIFRNTSNDLFQKKNGTVTSGLKVIKFRCKMCEFDFSEFLSDVNDIKAYTSMEKPFSPSIKINIGWVEQSEVLLDDGDDIRRSNILTGAFNSLTNRLSNALSSLERLPGSILGSITNDIQTRLEGLAMGNVYETGGLNGISNAINKFGASVTGRRAPVGPSFADLTNSKVYDKPGSPKTIKSGEIGDVY